MALLGKYVLIGEGVRGSLAKQLIAKFDLSKDREPQKFGIGIKELWQVKPENHRPGLVQHSFGWPLDMKTGGGSFLYHLEDNLVAVGFVVHLNYKNPYLYPFEEFQRFKTHPAIRGTFEGGKRLSYGARAITEGGWQSVPKLSFPGGALIGCSAGFVNVPRIKGSHNAVLSGMLAADKIAAAIAAGRANDEVGRDRERLARDRYRQGPEAGAQRQAAVVEASARSSASALGGLDMWTNQLFGFSLLRHAEARQDRLRQSLEPAAKHKKIDYPKPDGVLTFDRLSSVFLSNTNHEEDQPVHLQVEGHGAAEALRARRLRRPFDALLPGRRLRMGGEGRQGDASSSTRRTASTARPATSRTRTRTSTGCRRRAARGRSIRTCSRIACEFQKPGRSAPCPAFCRNASECGFATAIASILCAIGLINAD